VSDYQLLKNDSASWYISILRCKSEL
jgi:hypothetical protein